MAIFLLGIVGVLLGLFVPFNIPASFTPFLAMGLLAACNTLFGGLAAQVNHRFDARAFMIGFFSNALVAMLLTYAGAKLGVDFSLAAIVYFGTRIFNNLAKIQHSILQKESTGVKIKRMGERKMFPKNTKSRATSLQEDDDEE